MPDFTAHPLTPDRLADFAAMFETDGLTRGCWCMWWRQSARAWRDGDAATRRAGFAARVADGPPPGILGYLAGEAVGWAQICPRAELPRFDNARTAKPMPGTDSASTSALSCFFLRKDARGRGLMTRLAEAACRHAAANGAVAVEAAALEPHRKLVWGEGFVGLAPALREAGFTVVERRSPTRVLMRWTA